MRALILCLLLLPQILKSEVLSNIQDQAATSYYDKLTDSAGVIDHFTNGAASIGGRLRVGEEHTIFSYRRLFGTTGLYFQSVTFGAGAFSTFDLTAGATTISAGTAANGWTVYQTRAYWNIIPFQSTIAKYQVNFFGPVTGCVKRFGRFDDNDGRYWELSGTAASIACVVRASSSGVVNSVPAYQSSWNIDRLDGSGPPYNKSRITLDLTRPNTFFIESCWPMTYTRWGILINGKVVYCHEIGLPADVGKGYTRIRTSALPFRHEVRNWGTGPASPGHMSIFANSLLGEGMGEPQESRRWVQSSPISSGSVSDGTLRVLMSLRLKDAFKRGALKPTKYFAIQSTSTDAKLSLWLCQGGAGIGTAQNSLTWTAVADGRTGTEYSTSTFTLTTSTTGVLPIDEIGLAAGGTGKSSAEASDFISNPWLFLGADYDGNQDVLVLTYQPIGAAGTVPIYGIGFEETF